MAEQNLKIEKENTTEEKILIALKDRSGKLKKDLVENIFLCLIQVIIYNSINTVNSS